jgi:hypothetical protein
MSEARFLAARELLAVLACVGASVGAGVVGAGCTGETASPGLSAPPALGVEAPTRPAKTTMDPAPVEPTGPSSLTVTSVAYNLTSAPLGHVEAVGEVDGTTVVFGDAGLTVLSGGAPVGHDGSVTAWAGAATIPAADGDGTWLVGLGAQGEVYRVRANGAAEAVGARYGLAGLRARSAAATGAGLGIVFRVDEGLVLSDGRTATRFDGVVRAVAGGSGFAAVASGTALRMFDAHEREADTGVEGEVDLALVATDAAGHVLTASAHRLYARGGDGSLALVYDAGPRTIRALVASGPNVWAAVDGELGVYADGALALTAGAADADGSGDASGSAIAPGARLAGSPSGDVWVIAPSGALTKFAVKVSAQTADDQAQWKTKVLPIYARVCSHCHGAPGGGSDTSGIDLSSYGRWSARRAAVLERAVTDANTARAMPPPASGYTIDDADRAALRAWAGGSE